MRSVKYASRRFHQREEIRPLSVGEFIVHCETSGRFIDGYIPVLDVSGAVDGLVVGLGVLLGPDLLDLLQPRAAPLVLADTAGPAPGPLQT